MMMKEERPAKETPSKETPFAKISMLMHQSTPTRVNCGKQTTCICDFSVFISVIISKQEQIEHWSYFLYWRIESRK